MFFNQVFNENQVIVMLKSLAGGWACGRASTFVIRSITSLLWPIDTKLVVWVAYIKAQLRIAIQMFVITVKMTVTKNRKYVFASITLVCFGLLTVNLLYG